MTRSSALISVVALFVAGVSVGALGLHLYYVHGEPTSTRRGPDGPLHRAFAERLENLLELTPEQQQQIAGIREESHRQANTMRREIRPRLRQHLEQTREKIQAVLTPEQREKLEALQR